MTSTTQKTKVSSRYPSTEAALYFVEDIMQRAMVPFVLLGDVAKSVYNNLDVEVTDPIEIGISRRHYTEYAKSTLPMFLPPSTSYTDEQITFEHMDTPVTIKIINRNFKVLRNPDQVFYKLTTFRVPNPFETYWKQRNFVQ